MTQVIVFKNENGSVGIVTPAADWQGTMEDLQTKRVPQGLQSAVVNMDDLPAARDFREAWTLTVDGLVAVDIVQAQALQTERILAAYDAKLTKLDETVPRALESADFLDGYQQQVAQEKQALRTARAAVDLSSAVSIEAIRAAFPSEIQ